MPIITFDLPPIQVPFTENDVRSMDVGRRQLKTEWKKALHRPERPDENWRIILPFANTYENAFRSMVEINSYVHHGKDGRLIIFLNGTEGDKEAPGGVVSWLETVGHPVAMKDFLAISFALDYDKSSGNPQNPQTTMGALRARAKPYGGTAATTQTKEAADILAGHCGAFLNVMSCYSSADCVVAMPPCDPSNAFSLPRHLAKRIAKEWGREDLSRHLTGKSRNPIKGVPLAQKLDTLLGTLKVDGGVFAGRKPVLLDDLYQSGISMNYCGLLLLQAGAKKIFGLACEKTCRNDDNVGGKM